MAEESAAPVPAADAPKKASFIWATGRRKAAVARVRLRAGTGQIMVNKRPIEVYFPVERARDRALAPLQKTGMDGKLDVFVNCTGGGITGQSDAMMLGLARALIKYLPSLEREIRDVGFLTRDARVVERKKYGRPKARKRFQFSKR